MRSWRCEGEKRRVWVAESWTTGRGSEGDVNLEAKGQVCASTITHDGRRGQDPRHLPSDFPSWALPDQHRSLSPSFPSTTACSSRNCSPAPTPSPTTRGLGDRCICCRSILRGCNGNSLRLRPLQLRLQMWPRLLANRLQLRLRLWSWLLAHRLWLWLRLWPRLLASRLMSLPVLHLA